MLKSERPRATAKTLSLRGPRLTEHLLQEIMVQNTLLNNDGDNLVK